MRFALAICVSLLANGCASIRPAIPEQPNAPTSEAVVATVSKQWDQADQKVAASVSIAREMADRPDIVRSETSVALSFLPPVEAGELAVARARAIKADPKEAADAQAFGKKLLAQIDTSWLRVVADQKEAHRISQLKDARIVELTKAVEQAKKDMAASLWSMAGIAVAVLGAAAMVFTGPRIGGTLLACGAAIGAFPFVVESPYWNLIVSCTLAIACGLGLWYLWDKVKDANNNDEQPPPQV